MCLSSFFKFITGQYPESFFGTVNIELRNWFFVLGWTNFIAPFFNISRISWSTMAVSSWLIEIELGGAVWDGSERDGISYSFTNSKMKGSFVNFFRNSEFSGNTEDVLLAKNSACSLHITTFLSQDVCLYLRIILSTECFHSLLKKLTLKKYAYLFFILQIRSRASYLSVGYWVRGLTERAGW